MFLRLNYLCFVLSQRFLKKLHDDFTAEENGRLVLYIDGRDPSSELATPQQISKALREQVLSEGFQRAITKALSSASAKAEMNMSQGTNLLIEVPLNFQGSDEDLKGTLAGLRKLFEALKVLPKKPVIVLGKAQSLAAKKQCDVFPPPVLCCYIMPSF